MASDVCTTIFPNEQILSAPDELRRRYTPAGNAARQPPPQWQAALPVSGGGAPSTGRCISHLYREYRRRPNAPSATTGTTALFVSRFVLTRLSSDDDEGFYETVTLGEEMTTGRLRWPLA